MISLKSKVTKALLNYFFLNPQENFYINELTKKLRLDKRNLVKKMHELEKEGILSSRRRGNLKLYSINKGYSLYEEYKKIVLKTIGFEQEVRNIIRNTPGIKEAYIYGSYAKENMDANSDIDLLVIGSHRIIVLQRMLNKLQKEIDREINAVNMDEKEFEKRKKQKEPFITGIFQNKYIKLI